MKILLAEPRGFCSGVERALKMADSALTDHPGEALYLLHEIVHNENVSEEMASRGAKLVASVSGIPRGGRLLISAHGDTGKVFAEAQKAGLEILDATCPLVRQVQKKASALTDAGIRVLLFGNPEHREVRGILGQCAHPERITVLDGYASLERFEPEKGTKYACLSQTTWNADDVRAMTGSLQKKIPDLEFAGGVCFATSERQNAVRNLAEKCDAVLIVGSRTSSNTMRLLEIVRAAGKPAYLVPDAGSLLPEMTDGAEILGIASGASAPESLVQGIMNKLTDGRV